MAIALIGLFIFIAGGIAGGYLLIILGIRREERRRSMLHRQAPGLSSLAARPITGLWARQQVDAHPISERREDSYA
jgi:hypothetical protein